MIPKLNLKNQITFDHHRSGWSYAINALSELHVDNGIRFEGFIDRILFHKKYIENQFVAILHNPMFGPEGINKYKNRSSYSLLKSDCWKQNKKNCLGIFVLSKNLKNQIEDIMDFPCENLIHPTEISNIQFNFEQYLENKNIVNIGQWMRRFDSFYKIKYVGKKTILNITKEEVPKDIIDLKRIPNNEFDILLSNSITFSHFFDVVACNGILDSISRNTPICCNRLPAAEEYLGKDYPLFFETLKEAESLIANENKILETHIYLKNMNKDKFSKTTFCKSIHDSGIYKRLPNVIKAYQML